MITIDNHSRAAWSWTLAVAGAVSVIGIAINIATDMKTSFLAWLAVVVGTVTGGIVTRAAQLATGDGRSHPALAIASVVGTVVTIIFGTVALTSTPESESAKPTAARTIQSVPSYQLVSSSDFCPTNDKIDLDTARSGHGGQTQLGDYVEKCRVEGGLAELILEQDELHTPKNSQLLYLPEPGEATSQDKCRAALRDSERLRNRIPLTQLNPGDHICVKTDQGNIAEITIQDMSRTTEAKITIRFTTWNQPN